MGDEGTKQLVAAGRMGEEALTTSNEIDSQEAAVAGTQPFVRCVFLCKDGQICANSITLTRMGRSCLLHVGVT